MVVPLQHALKFQSLYLSHSAYAKWTCFQLHSSKATGSRRVTFQITHISFFSHLKPFSPT